jgi:N,N'-diacetyllegionaminate synthase
MNLFGRNLDQELCVVAEVGLNHEGSVQKAKEMIISFHQAGADAVKLQSFTLERYCSRMDAARYERLGKFGLSRDAHDELFSWARQLSIPLFSTPLTEDWVTYLAEQSGVVKIASGDSTFLPTVELAADSGALIILSTGATTVEELDVTMQHLEHRLSPGTIGERVALMQCVASYPAPDEEANLGAIRFLRERYKTVVGFSSHFISKDIPISAVATGASVLEVHVTDSKENRNFRDHSLAFEPDDFRDLVERARIVHRAAREHVKRVQPSEMATLAEIRKGIVASRDLRAGDRAGEESLLFARSPRAASWRELQGLIGRRLLRSIPAGFPVADGDLDAPPASCS